MPDERGRARRIQSPKVMVIDFRPDAVPSHWARTEDLVRQYISTMIAASKGLVTYQVAKRKTIRDYPLLADGRRYTDSTWLAALQNDQMALRDAHNNYVMADYIRIIQDLSLLALVRDRVIDEVWMFGGPYFGFYESRMVGRGAYWCNAPAIEQTGRRFVMMGYNYQRDLSEMVHNFGHRAESILGKKFNSMPLLNLLYRQQPAPAPANEFETFLAQNGTTHRVPGGADYSQDELSWVKKLKPEWWPSAVNPNLA
ncbi:MAG: hypothetical protein HFACDABA_00592 [Anaerolineales bacterium]|nr:hypothetical protein [Anaerolineales bacterium]